MAVDSDVQTQLARTTVHATLVTVLTLLIGAPAMVYLHFVY